MRTNYVKYLFVYVALTVAIFSQPVDPDLVVQSEITPDYIGYLAGREATWLLQIAQGGDNAETMKAHMGLAVLSFAWSHVDGDTVVADLHPILEDFSESLDSLGRRIDVELLPIFIESSNMGDSYERLSNFLESEDYGFFRDTLEIYLDKIHGNMAEAGNSLVRWSKSFENNFSEEHFQAHLDAIREGTADFEFSIQIVGSEYENDLFIFSRTFIDRTQVLGDLDEQISAPFENGSDWLDSVMAISDGDVMPGIAYYREGLNKITSYLDTLELILTNDPFTPFAIDVSPLDSLLTAVARVDTLLGGKEYPIGPEVEGKTIKPLAIIQNLPGSGMWGRYVDFYRSSDSSSYTFGDIFPRGLPAEALNIISADAVINAMDDHDSFDNRLQELKSGWLAKIAVNPADVDAHLGVALVLFYETVRDNVETLADAFRLMDEGRIDSLTYFYDWDSFSLHADLSQISDHADYYVESIGHAHFILIVKTEEDSYGRYEIGPESQFDIIHVAPPSVEIVKKSLSMVGDAFALIEIGLTSIFDEMSRVFVADLDPNVLDFSLVESDTDLVLMLETSNPSFLSVTPYGVEQFYQAGNLLKQGFDGLCLFFDWLGMAAHSTDSHGAEFSMDADSMLVDGLDSLADILCELSTDFAYADSATTIEGERVNFSAWFDNPPASFLVMWKNYIFGIDSTLGGLFPDRLSVGIQTESLPSLPKEFTLYPNRPNPFNPITQITFDMPKPGKASLIIYNIRGEEVTRLVDEYMKPGRKVVTWNARGLSSGIYICRLDYGGTLLWNKMMLIK